MVSIATVADVVPLRGENRIMVHHGLRALHSSRNPGIRALIRDGKTHQLYSAIQTGGRLGMTTMAQSLARLVKERKLKMADAEKVLSDPSELKNAVRAA